MSSKIKQMFSQELAKGDQQINLAYAALLLAEYLTGPLDIALYLARVQAGSAPACRPCLCGLGVGQGGHGCGSHCLQGRS